MGTVATTYRADVGQITLRYWAAARAAAGVAEELVEVDGPVLLATLLAGIADRHGPGSTLQRVIASCSVLVDDRPVSTLDPATVQVVGGQTVEFLPPFAGG